MKRLCFSWGVGRDLQCLLQWGVFASKEAHEPICFSSCWWGLNRIWNILQVGLVMCPLVQVKLHFPEIPSLYVCMLMVREGHRDVLIGDLLGRGGSSSFLWLTCKAATSLQLPHLPLDPASVSPTPGPGVCLAPSVRALASAGHLYHQGQSQKE